MNKQKYFIHVSIITVIGVHMKKVAIFADYLNARSCLKYIKIFVIMTKNVYNAKGACLLLIAFLFIFFIRCVCVYPV